MEYDYNQYACFDADGVAIQLKSIHIVGRISKTNEGYYFSVLVKGSDCGYATASMPQEKAEEVRYNLLKKLGWLMPNKRQEVT